MFDGQGSEKDLEEVWGRGNIKYIARKYALKKLKQEKICEGFGVPSAKGEQPSTDNPWQ